MGRCVLRSKEERSKIEARGANAACLVGRGESGGLASEDTTEYHTDTTLHAAVAVVLYAFPYAGQCGSSPLAECQKVGELGPVVFAED